MANFSKNITNAVNVFGQGPSTKWGQTNGTPYTFVWGVSTWGEGYSLPIDVRKIISNALLPTWNYSRSDQVKVSRIGTFVATSDMDSEELRDGTGLWEYVFTSDTVEGESRSFAQWSEGAEPTTSFSCQTAGSTSWSET